MNLVSIIHTVIDFFYPPFKKIMDKNTFRYAACGGANTVLGWVLFHVLHDYVFDEKEPIMVFGFPFSAHFITACICFVVNTIIGFLLMKYVVFTKSNLRKRTQAIRYIISSFTALGTSILLLKFFVEMCHWDATVSQILATSITVILSYILQSRFSFKTKNS